MTREESTKSVIAMLNGMLGIFWSANMQHQSHVALLQGWGILGLAKAMDQRTLDEPITIRKLTDRIIDLGGIPDFQPLPLHIGSSLREVLDNDAEGQRMTRGELNKYAEQAAAAHDATTRIMVETILADEEEHLGWLETELDLYDRLGEAMYLSSRLSEQAAPTVPLPA